MEVAYWRTTNLLAASLPASENKVIVGINGCHCAKDYWTLGEMKNSFI